MAQGPHTRRGPRSLTVGLGAIEEGFGPLVTVTTAVEGESRHFYLTPVEAEALAKSLHAMAHAVTVYHERHVEQSLDLPVLHDIISERPPHAQD